MEIIKVKCPKGKKIEIEKGRSTLVTCPEECNLLKLKRCSRKNFNYTEILSNLVSVDFSLVNNSKPQIEEVNIIDEYEPEPKNDELSFVNPFDSFQDDILTEDLTEDNETDINVTNNAINKYNKMFGTTSIFDNIIVPRPDEPCFVDGIYVFYERYTMNSSGGVADAIRYLFLHWYTSYVFNSDEKSLKEEFLILLKLAGFTKDENKILEIIENVEFNINQKFFHLFYDVIYKGEMSSFYWSDVESPFSKILPKFKDRQDFINKLSKNPLFFKSLEKCLPEILLYFNKDKESFFEDITIELSKMTKKICFFNEAEGKIKLNSLGNTSDFINNLPEITTKEKLHLKCEFFKNYTFTMNGNIILRKDKFVISKSNKTEDDSIYQALGIVHFGSSNCATIYNYYVSVLNEYIKIFYPKRISVGNLLFTKDNFFYELVDILIDACKNLTYRGRVPLSSRYYLTKSLIERGVFDYYIEQCETSRLKKIIDFYLLDEPTIKDYLSINGIGHLFNTDKGECSVSEYISLCLDKDKLRTDFNGDVIIQTYFDLNVDEKYVNGEIKKLDSLIEKNNKLIKKFLKVGEK